jgi:polyribonucleotide nucleotidyltransferase
MDLKKQILVALGLDKGEEVNMEWQGKSDDGTLFVSTAEELEEGADFSVLTEDGTTILAPIGTYRLDSGVSVRIEEEGVIAEIIQSETETEEVEEEEMTEELEVEDDAFERLSERVQNLEDAIADLKADKVEATEEVEELAEEEVRGTTPKSIKTTEVVEFSIEDLKAENERLKTELASAPASAPLDTNKFSSERATPTAQDFKRMTKQEKFLYNLHN